MEMESNYKYYKPLEPSDYHDEQLGYSIVRGVLGIDWLPDELCFIPVKWNGWN